MLIEAAAIFLGSIWAIVEGVRFIVAHERAKRQAKRWTDAWPPQRVIEVSDDIPW